MNYVDKQIETLKTADIPSARLDVFMIIEHVCNKERAWLLAHPEFEPTDEQKKTIEQMVRRRAAAVPVAYILGSREFFGLAFEVSESVLVPRPETEELVAYAIENIGANASVLELGTGSGAIAVSLGANRPDLQITATDISPSALVTAQKNAQTHAPTIMFVESDLFAHVDGKYDVVLANLPYVPVGARRQADIEHEPDIALYGGEDGLDYYRRFFKVLSQHLTSSGWAIIEFSPTQYAAVREEFSDFEITPLSEYIYVCKPHVD